VSPEHPADEPFQENGEWRCYDAAGTLLRWDTAIGGWVTLAPAAGPPPPLPPPAWPTTAAYGATYGATTPYGVPASGRIVGIGNWAFASLKTPAVFLYVTFGIFAITTVVVMIGLNEQLRISEDVHEGGNVFQSLQQYNDAKRADDMVSAGASLQSLEILAALAFFAWWSHRATGNLAELGAQDPDFGPGWAAGWWFIPVANLVQPLRVLLHAWRGSDPANSPGASDAWRRASGSILMIVWWVAWWAAAGMFFLNRVLYGRETPDLSNESQYHDWRTAKQLALGAEAVALLATVLAIAVVARLAARQDRSYELRWQEAHPLATARYGYPPA
jgi:hypothetical protein